MTPSATDPACELEPILPRRRLRLRGGYVRAMRRRIAIGVALTLMLLASLAWPAGDVAEAWALESNWRRAEPLDTVSIDVQHGELLALLHSIDTTVVYRDATGERVVNAESFRVVGPFSPAAAREARRDRTSGGVATSVGTAARLPRLVTALLLLGVLGTSAIALARLTRDRARELTMARRAARASREIVVQLIREPRRSRYVFDAASSEAVVGYRQSARGRERIDLRVLTDEPRPLLFGPDRTLAVALLTERGDVLVVRDDLWPLDVTPEERETARARMAERA